MRLQEARTAWEQHRPNWERHGLIASAVEMYYPDGIKDDWHIAYDAQPTLSSDPNSALPIILTTMIDPEVVEYVFAPLKLGEIATEERRGTWTDDNILFPTVEHTGEVASYGDNNNSGAAGANMDWPARQAFLVQNVKQYGEREVDRAGLGKINLISEIDKASASVVNRFHNLSYGFGIAGLANYGMFNDPSLTTAITPLVKANGNGNVWVFNNGPNASANEVYNDILALYQKLIQQSQGDIDEDTEMTLAMSPGSAMAMGFANGFAVHTRTLIKDQFPNLTIKTAPQYGVLNATNPQGILAGNLVQMFANKFGGTKTMFAAYNEKMRAFAIVKEMSAFKQKVASGTWGTVIRRPVAIAQMIGV